MNDEAKRFKELNRFSENAKNEFNTLISARFQNAFTTHFEKALKENRPPEKSEIENFSIETVKTAEDKALFDFTQRVLLLSLLLGNEHADRRVQLADDDFGIGASFGIPSKDALAYLKSQIPLTKDEYAELERKLQFRAFTVSKLAEADFVNKAKASLIDGIEHSKSFSEIWDEFKKIGSDAGIDISAGYFETVYRTNIQSAYNAGRLMRYKNNQPPAWELLFMEDGNMSEICTALMNEVGGKAIKSDDPFWSTVGFPPYHYNCRTTFRAVYDYELNEGEIDLAAPKKSAPLDNGFGGNPLEKESWWKLTDTMKERAKEYGLKDGIETMAKKLGVKDFTISPASKTPKVHLAKKEPKPQTAAASSETVKGKPLDKLAKIEENKEQLSIDYKEVDEDRERKLKQRHNRVWNKKFSEEEKDTVWRYSYDAYTDINRYLRGIDILGGKDVVEKQIKIIDEALSKSKLGDDLILKRGVCKEEFEDWKNNTIIKTYKSTTIKKTADPMFKKGYEITIKAPKTLKGFYIGDYSEYKNEKEFLIHRNQKYKILKITDNILEVEFYD